MVLGSEIDSPAVRFGLYINELQDFFGSRGMHFGSQEDLFRLAERLSGPSFFYDEMSSMVRAIIYREAEGVSREELVELVAVAISGPYIDLTASRFQEPVRQLMTFFGGVLRSLFKAFPDEVSADEVPAAPADVPAPAHREQLEIAAEPAQVSAIPQSHGQILAAPVVTDASLEASAEPSGDVLSRARAALDRAAHPEPVVLAYEAPPAPVLAGPGSVRERRIRPWTGRLAFWIAGVCGLLVGLAGGLLLRYRPPNLSVPDLNIAQTHHPALSPPKLSPDELPIRDTRLRRRVEESPAQAPAFRSSGVPARRPQPPARDAAAGAYPAQTVGRNTGPPFRKAQSGVSSQALSYPVSRQAAPVLAESYAWPSTPATSESISSDLPRTVSPAPVSPTANVFLASSGVMASNLLFAPSPEYPAQARSEGIEGRVVLQALVWRDGTVAATHVLRGDRLLSAAAAEAVRHWRYRPYVVDGNASDVATIVTVNFQLR